MKIAVLFTGRFDHLHASAPLILRNLLDCNGPVNVFYYLDSNSEDPFPLSCFEPHTCVGRVVSNTGRSPEYRDILDNIMRTAPALRPEMLQHFDPEFFYRAGAILEYYQFMKAYEVMLEYERSSGCRFDVVVRSRLDIVPREALTIRRFFEGVDEEMLAEFGTQVYVQSLGIREIAERIRDSQVVPLFEYRNAEFHHHSEIHSHKIMWTLYCNWVWVAKRNTMDLMPHFVYRYGALSHGATHHCFNSENQFHFHLLYHNVKLAYYFTRTEWDLWDDHELRRQPVIDASGNWVSESSAIVALVRHVH